MSAPVETKVQASTGAAAISGFLVWALQTYVFKGKLDPTLQSWIYVAVPGVLAFVAGYFAPHTPRPAVPPLNFTSEPSPPIPTAPTVSAVPTETPKSPP